MRIVISGVPGSGKSTAAKTLAKKLGYKHYSIGDMQRELAREKGITLLELSELEEKDDSIDRMIDEKQKKLGDKDKFVLDSRLGALFIPHADLKIFLDCDLDERAKRIHFDNRDLEKGDIKRIIEDMKRREMSEEKRFKDFYGFDYKDKKNYHLYLDTTELSKEKVLKIIYDSIARER